MDIVRSGVIMLAYAVVIVIAFIVLSNPFERMMVGFEDINMTASDDYLENQTALSRTVFNMTFAGLIIVPFIWFIMWAMRREPDWRP